VSDDEAKTIDPQEVFRGLWQLRDRDLGLLASLLAAQGIDVQKSPAESLRWCRRHAESGEANAQHALAKLLWIGLAGRNDREAFEWCTKASAQGYLPATVMLSGFYSTGIGVDVDHAKAIALLGSAVESGSPEAMVLLAASYEHEIGVKKDHAKAVHLWRSAARLGNADAQCSLGRELIESQNPDEVAEGVRWLRSAADQGNGSAHYELANLYETGRGGLPEDKQQAERHRARAAELWGE
jgi:TPR repeat protein